MEHTKGPTLPQAILGKSLPSPMALYHGFVRLEGLIPRAVVAEPDIYCCNIVSNHGYLSPLFHWKESTTFRKPS